MSNQFTRSLYELSITDDRPPEPAAKCKYIMRAGPAAGEQCTKDAVEGSEFCEGCAQKKEAVQNPRLPGRRPPGPNPQLPQCEYINARGQNKGLQCPNAPEVGINLCTQHKSYRAAQLRQVPVQPQVPPPPPEKKEFVPPSSYKLRFKAIRDLSSLRESQTLTDITLVASDGATFQAHKFVLFVASPYFGGFFTSGFKETEQKSIVLKDVSSKVLQLYLDLIYGKEVSVKDWKEAFDLFDYFNSTLLNWLKDPAVTAFWVSPEEYVEYIQRLEKICGELTEDVIKATKKYVNAEMDLSSFEPEFVRLVRPPKIPQLTVTVLADSDCYWEADKGLVIKPTDSGVYVCLGYLPKTTLPSVRGAVPLPLTPELEDYCRSLGMTYQPPKLILPAIAPDLLRAAGYVIPSEPAGLPVIAPDFIQGGMAPPRLPQLPPVVGPVFQFPPPPAPQPMGFVHGGIMPTFAPDFMQFVRGGVPPSLAPGVPPRPNLLQNPVLLESDSSEDDSSSEEDD